jgi:uncharacterized delta-60 repeat protein
MVRFARALATALISALSFVNATAQDGANDPTFHTLDDGLFGEGARGTSSFSGVQAGVLQPDGSLWLAGGFSHLHGSPRPAIARVDADGSYDSSFSPGAGVTGPSNAYYVQELRRQPDGRVLLAGRFDHYDGQPRSNVARALANGAVDPSFVPPSLGIITAMALQPDGRVIVAGQFSIIEGARRSQLARLNPDGSLDLSFNPGEGPGGVEDPEVSALELQPDGRILVGGHFRRMNGVTRWRIARLMPDGSLDASFDPGTGFDSYVAALAVQPDGAVIAAGDFLSVNGTGAVRLARLLSNGAVDPQFNAGSGTNYSATFVRLQPDGKALVGGLFTTCGGAPRSGIARLNTDGSNDASFDPGLGLVGACFDALPLSNGQHILVGGFTRVDGTARGGFARLNADGSHDLSYNPNRGPDDAVRAAAIRPDGKWLIAGEFLGYDTHACNSIARLNQDGSFDTSYTPGSGPNGTISRIRMQPDGGAFVVGGFSLYDGVARKMFAKLDAQGALDPSFDPGTGVLGTVQDLLVQRDGKVVIAGFFTQYNGVAAKSVARLLPDGQFDPSFNVGTGSQFGVQLLAKQPDGKLLVYGGFSDFNGVPRSRIARLNPDGSVDLSFDPGFGPSGLVQAIAVEADGKILIGGSFTHFDGLFRPSLVRLLSDGSVDPAGFAVPNTTSSVLGIEPQLDSSVLLYGTFSSINNVPRRSIARVFQNGTLDLSFDSGLGASGSIFATAREPGGDLVIAGEFTQYDGAVRHRIARVKLAWVDWVNYCTAGVSSAGCVPSLAASGSASVSATSGFTLAVQNVDGNRQGLVFYALGGRTSAPITPTSTSFFCVRGPVQRTAVRNSGGADGRLQRHVAARLARLRRQQPRRRRRTVQRGRERAGARLVPRPGGAQGRDAERRARVHHGAVSPFLVRAAGLSGRPEGPAARSCRSESCLKGPGRRPRNRPSGVTSRIPRHYRMESRADDESRATSSGCPACPSRCGASRRRRYCHGPLRSCAGNGADFGILSVVNATAQDGANDPDLQHAGRRYLRGRRAGALQLVRRRRRRAAPAGRKFWIAGEFASVNGTPRAKLARINADGSLDFGFTPGSGPASQFSGSASIDQMVLQPNGDVLVSGSFDFYDGAPRTAVARLLPNGALDPGFAPQIVGWVREIALQPGRKGADWRALHERRRRSAFEHRPPELRWDSRHELRPRSRGRRCERP